MGVNWENRHVLVLGAAKSGIAAARFLKANGAHVIVNVGSEPPLTEQQQIKELGVRSVYGEHPLELLDDVTMIVKNPGIPYHIPILQEALKREIPILTEVELAYLATDAPFVAITGSNGKTTTTTLVYELLKGGEKRVHLAGNIGFPAIEVAVGAKANDVIVIELSSFQLMGIDTFRPAAAAFLNLSPAHLDYHGTFDEYAAAKLNLFRNMTDEDRIVVNGADKEITRRVEQLHRPSTFAWDAGDAHVEDGWIVCEGERVIELDQVALGGKHNIENILAALLLIQPFDIPLEHVQKVLRQFGGVAHRTEWVGDVLGRHVYNDSKATNNVATEAALSGFHQPIVWVCGGLERGADLSPLKQSLGQVKTVVAYGQTAERFKALGEEMGIQAFAVPSLTEAVDLAFTSSTIGDVVLLSPACASWDQYETFEQRGDHFKQLVAAYEEANR